MFSGIIEKQGRLVEKSAESERGLFLLVDTAFNDLALGESISINGVCLTVTEFTSSGRASFFVSRETLDRTNFRELKTESQLNLERAVTPQTRLSGHIVQGHVDGLGKVLKIQEDGESYRLQVKIPRELTRYIVSKGSITLNGVSLTVNEIKKDQIDVNIIPFTWEHTNLGKLSPEDSVTLEVDILAKYIQKQLEEKK